jgi:aminoglycoside phosphotransferase
MTLDQALARFNDEQGVSYAVAGGFHHGEVGATLVIDADRRRAVAKWDWPATRHAMLERQAMVKLVERLRSRGACLPAYLHVAAVDDGVLLVQEFLPGKTGDRVPDALVEDLIAHNALQAKAAPGGSGWKAYMLESLSRGMSGYCEHASLQAYSRATGALLDRIRAAGDALITVAVEEDDAVHVDFHHLNVLSEDGRLSGVVDCEGYRSGDRMFDLITLAFCLSVADHSRVAERRLWSLIERSCDIVTSTAYVAHMALRQVDWSIRHRTRDDVTQWLTRSEQVLEQLRG